MKVKSLRHGRKESHGPEPTSALRNDLAGEKFGPASLPFAPAYCILFGYFSDVEI
jgi:hypothetical protein